MFLVQHVACVMGVKMSILNYRTTSRNHVTPSRRMLTCHPLSIAGLVESTCGVLMTYATAETESGLRVAVSAAALLWNLVYANHKGNYVLRRKLGGKALLFLREVIYNLTTLTSSLR
jgi:hypothetical protein